MSHLCSQAPEMTSSYHSDDAAGGNSGPSGPITESPAQEHALPSHDEDELKPEGSASTQEFAGSDSTVKSPAQGHHSLDLQGILAPESNQEVTGKQEEFLSPGRRQECEDSATVQNQTMCRDRYVPFSNSRVPAAFYYPVNMHSRENSASLYLNGFGMPSSEVDSTVGYPDHGEQARLPGYEGSSLECSVRERYMPQASNHLAWDPLVANQARAGTQVSFPRNQSGAAQPLSDQDLHHNAPCTTLDTASHRTIVFPPAQVETPPLPESLSHQPKQDKGAPPSPENNSLPQITGFVDPTPPPRRLQYPWKGYNPNVNEGRRRGSGDSGGLPACLVQGPTRPLGPPLKPLDPLSSEAVAQERMRNVELQNARHAAKGQGRPYPQGIW